jgi:hypothetical protein
MQRAAAILQPSQKEIGGLASDNNSSVMSAPDDDWENDVVVPVAPPAPAQLPEFPALLRSSSAGHQQSRQQQLKKAEQQQQQQQHQSLQGYVPFEKDAPALHPLLQEIASSDHNSLLFRVEDKIQRFLQDSQVKQIAINGVGGNNATMVCCLGEHFGLKVICSASGSITLTKQPSTRRYPPGLGMLPGGSSASPQVKVMMRKEDQSAGSSRFQQRGNDARVQQFAAQRQENKVPAAAASPARFHCVSRVRPGFSGGA